MGDWGALVKQVVYIQNYKLLRYTYSSSYNHNFLMIFAPFSLLTK